MIDVTISDSLEAQTLIVIKANVEGHTYAIFITVRHETESSQEKHGFPNG
jgi:hypothetical protein